MTDMKKNAFMKLFKSAISLFMVMALLFVFAGCSSSGGKDDGGENAGNNATTPNYDNLTPSEYFAALELNNAGGLVDALTSVYGALSQSSNTANYGTEMDISLQVGDLVQDMLEESFYAETGTRVDFSFLSKVNLEMDLNVKDQLQKLDMGLGLGSSRILTISTIMDLSDFTTWVGIPELSNKFAEMSLSELGQMGGFAPNMATMQSSTALVEALPEAQQLNTLIKRYVSVALESLKNVERKDITLELDGLKQNCTVLEVKIYEQDALNMVKAVLNTAKTDADLKTIIEKMSTSINELMEDTYGQYGGSWTEIDLYEAFVDLIGEALEVLEMEGADLDTEEYIELTTYIDSAHNIIGRKLAFDGDEMHYYTVTEGNAFTFEAEIGDVSVTGSGTDKSGVVDGTYTLNVEGSDMLNLKVKGWSATADSVKGSLILEPSAQMINEAVGSASALPFTDIALELKIDSDNSKSSFEINLLSNDALVVGIAMGAKSSSGTSIQKPSQTVDVTDPYQLQAWAESMDFDKLIQNLRKAGVPSQLLDMLEDNLF